MARGGNRRKTVEPYTIVSTSTSAGTADSDKAANADKVLYLINLTSITAGSITFKIQTSPDDGNQWFDLSTGEMNGNTGALATAGLYHVSSSVPFGVRTRLYFTIVTGPVAFLVYPIYERTGNVY